MVRVKNIKNVVGPNTNNMFFIPGAILTFILFLLFLPFLFALGYLNIIVIGFEALGISSRATLIILASILVGSLVNIPLTKKKMFLVQESRFFGFFKSQKMAVHCLAVNLGGAVIPCLLSFYLLFIAQRKGFDLKPIFIATLLMTLLSKIFSKVVPGKGIVLPFFIPPVFSAILALILAPGYVAFCAFISGVLGTLIGADILNIWKIRNFQGYLSIGGAGVFDGIFLVGIMSVLISGVFA